MPDSAATSFMFKPLMPACSRRFAALLSIKSRASSGVRLTRVGFFTIFLQIFIDINVNRLIINIIVNREV